MDDFKGNWHGIVYFNGNSSLFCWNEFGQRVNNSESKMPLPTF